MMRPAVLAWAAALLLLLAAVQLQPVNASSGLTFTCPDCDLNNKAKYECSTPVSSNRHLCTECPDGLVACGNDLRGLAPGCRNLTNDNLNCGACGNKCSGDQPNCVGTTCGCSATSPLCGTSKFCDIANQRCQQCPAGRANCRTIGNTGVEADCEVDLNTDANNCGVCGNQCGNGETCVNGKCQCGTTPSCTYPNEICDNGACVECTDATDDLICSKDNNIFLESRFCNPTTRQCETCPAGFADCDATKLPSGTDDGTTSDCETNIAQTGQQANCGACGASCGFGNTAQTCCSGVCKCGNFSSNLAPSAEECAAATQCKSTEYCDQRLQMCLPLFNGNEVCSGNANNPTDNYFNFEQKETCGTCNRTEGLKNIVNNTCQTDNDLACGASGELCKDGQTCFKGKCECSLSTFRFFQFNRFTERDPDRDNKIDVFGRPGGNCDSTAIAQVVFGFFGRVQNTIDRFIDCVRETNPPGVDRITPARLQDPGFRASVCPGGPGLCPTAFCDALVRNLTDVEKGPFCGEAEKAAAEFKRCAIDYRLNENNAGDLTCANNFMHEIVASGPTSFSFIDAYNFLGCREKHDDMAIIITGASPKSFMHRVETGRLLLGAAVNFQLSTAVVAVVAVLMGAMGIL